MLVGLVVAWRRLLLDKMSEIDQSQQSQEHLGVGCPISNANLLLPSLPKLQQDHCWLQGWWHVVAGKDILKASLDPNVPGIHAEYPNWFFFRSNPGTRGRSEALKNCHSEASRVEAIAICS